MFRSLSFAAVAALLPLSALACDGFEVRDAYARASTGMSQSGAAFMILHNQGGTDCHVTAVRSDVAQRTELHTHLEDSQGVMRMVEIEGGIPLAAGGEHMMERGGDHVMFLGLTRPLVQGETVVVTFVFDNGAERAVEVPVDMDRQPGARSHGQSHGHAHGHSHGN